MKKLISILILALITVNVSWAYAATSKVKSKYVPPTITSSDIKYLNKFVETHAKLIPYVEEKKTFPVVWCRYLNSKSLRVSDLFSANMVVRWFKWEKETVAEAKNDVSAEALLAFWENSATACDKNVIKYIKWVKVFADFISMAKSWNVSTAPKMIADLYIKAGDAIMDLFIAKAFLLNEQISEWMYSPVLVSYIRMTGQNMGQFFVATGWDTKKYDIFTWPLYVCYLTSQKQSEMKSCLNTFVSTIKNNATFTSGKKADLKAPKY